MATINTVKMKGFKKSEFSEDPNKFAHVRLLHALQEYRNVLDAPFYPSTADGALARFNKEAMSSQHYAKQRRSTAIDGFPDTNIFEAWTKAIHSGLFGGIGVYFDTKRKRHAWPMLHLDLRIKKLLWFRDEGEYRYSSEGAEFYMDLYDKFSDFGFNWNLS